jgi:hypothetical protein
MKRAVDWLLKGGDLNILAALQSAGIAQLVEHLIRNEEVRGSNPRAGTSQIKKLRARRVAAFTWLLFRTRFVPQVHALININSDDQIVGQAKCGVTRWHFGPGNDATN